jgi:Bacterial extracellular solute-binding proteins, family 3
LRTLFIGAIAFSLVGCSRQPSPQTTTELSAGPIARLERAIGPPLQLTPFRTSSAAIDTNSTSYREKKKSLSAHGRHQARFAKEAAKFTRFGKRAGPVALHVSLPTASPKTRVQHVGNAASASAKTTRVTVVEPHSTIGAFNSDTRASESQVVSPTAPAEQVAPAVVATPDIKTNDEDKPVRREILALGHTEAMESPLAKATDRMIIVLMARSDIASLSDLTGKTIAVDTRYSASEVDIRTAIVAAGGSLVQLSESQTTAMNRLVNGEVPAAVLALVSADQVIRFPEIANFKVFHVPISPHGAEPPS